MCVSCRLVLGGCFRFPESVYYCSFFEFPSFCFFPLLIFHRDIESVFQKIVIQVLRLFKYTSTLKGRYIIGKVGRTAFMGNARSLLPTWSVPLVYYHNPWYSTPKTMDLGHSWRIVPQTDAQGPKKKQCRLGDLPGMWENCVLCVHLSVDCICPIVCPTADGSPASSLRLCLHVVLGTRFPRQAPNPMMPYGRPVSVAKPVTKLVVRARIWSTMPWYGLQQALVDNRLLRRSLPTKEDDCNKKK